MPVIIKAETVEYVVDVLVGISDALPENVAVQLFILDLLLGIQRLADPPPPPVTHIFGIPVHEEDFMHISPGSITVGPSLLHTSPDAVDYHIEE